MDEQSKEQRVHRVFENIYEQYDQMNSVISFKQHVRWRADIMKRMKVKPGSKVLDVCCGTGDWTLQLVEAVGSDGEVTGLDFSKNMLKIGEEKLKRFSNVNLVHGNAMELPFPDDSFDYVTIGFGLRNVPNIEQVLKELYRVVKPGGMVVSLDTSHPTLFGFKQLYYFYFRFIMPVFGKIFAKSYQEYSWLNESTRHFPGMKKLAGMFEGTGFKNVTYTPYTGGVAAAHFGYKQK